MTQSFAEPEQGAAWGIVAYTGCDGLRQLEADWRRLVAAMPHRGFQHAFETHLAYHTHLPSTHGPLTCLALTDGARIRAICPLEPGRARIFAREIPVWGLPFGLGNVVRDVICPPDDETERRLLPAIVRFLQRAPGRPAWLVFDRVLESSAVWRCLRVYDPRAFCTDDMATVDLLDCRQPFEVLSAGLSRKFRSNLRNARTKLASLSDVQFRNVTDPSDLAREFDTFLAVENAGWKGERGAGSALRQRPSVLAWYRELLATMHDGDRCEFNVLYAEGRCLASLLCIRTGAEYALIKICHDEEYARVTPGRLLLDWTVERCCRDPELERVNLVSHQEWLRSWHPTVLPVRSAYIGLSPWSGRMRVRLLRGWFTYIPRLKAGIRRIAALTRAR